MNAHVKPDPRPSGASPVSSTDRFEMEVCDHARRAQATVIIARKIVGDLRCAADSKYQMPANALVEIIKRDVTLLIDFIEELENEAQSLRGLFYEVIE